MAPRGAYQPVEEEELEPELLAFLAALARAHAAEDYARATAQRNQETP